MEHWSKTSTSEPLPVGRHKKRNTKVDDGRWIYGDFPRAVKFEKDVKVYPPFRRSHGVFMRPIFSERNCTSNAGYGEQSSVGFDNTWSPKPISTVHDGVLVEDRKRKRCLSPSLFPQQDGGTASSKMGKSDVPPSNGDENEKSHIQEREKAPASEASTAGQSTKDTDEWALARKKVKSALSDFRAYCDYLSKQDKKKRGFKRVDFEAGKLFKKKYGYQPKPFLGPIPGIEIGDKFNYRMELNVLGLHRPIRWGIDSMESGGRKIAISIVDSGGHDNCRRDQDTLIYCGEGGNSSRNGGQECSTEDQKLIKGNLALMNSIKTKNPVRVIRESKALKNPVRVIRGSKALNSVSLCYDGLYTVEKMWKERKLGGHSIFKFKLVRIPGQPSPFLRRAS